MFFFVLKNKIKKFTLKKRLLFSSCLFSLVQITTLSLTRCRHAGTDPQAQTRRHRPTGADTQADPQAQTEREKNVLYKLPQEHGME